VVGALARILGGFFWLLGNFIREEFDNVGGLIFGWVNMGLGIVMMLVSLLQVFF